MPSCVVPSIASNSRCNDFIDILRLNIALSAVRMTIHQTIHLSAVAKSEFFQSLFFS